MATGVRGSVWVVVSLKDENSHMSGRFTLEECTAALQSHFGFSDFRDGQLEVIQSLVDGHDTIALFPTGAGKSLCFQLSGLLLTGLTIVVSPLIALMKDQVEHLQTKKIAATYFASHLSDREKRQRLQDLQAGKYHFLYLSPEKLLHAYFLKDLLAHTRLIIVDEAHCISLWGKSFRPSYLSIKEWLESIPNRPPVGAFTASATEVVLKDIRHFLQLRSPHMFRKSFYRENLRYGVFPQSTQVKQLEKVHAWIAAHPQQDGIVYAGTREAVEQWAYYLRRFYPTTHVVAYHAGIPAAKRLTLQAEFIEGKRQILVATSAFGMGVDKPDVRWVLHTAPPTSLEDYIQEAGRAGRDGNLADCGILFSAPQWSRVLEQFDQTWPQPDLLIAVHSQISRLTKQHRRGVTFAEISQAIHRSLPEKQLDYVLRKLRTFSFIERKGDAVRLDAQSAQSIYNLRTYAQRFTIELKKLQVIEQFLLRKQCRTATYLRYFGETFLDHNCEHCDQCRLLEPSVFASIHAVIPHSQQLFPRFQLGLPK